MTIYVNSEAVEVTEPFSLQDLVAFLGVTPDRKGVALAVGDRVVPKTNWGETFLHENERVVLIEATCGG